MNNKTKYRKDRNLTILILSCLFCAAALLEFPFSLRVNRKSKDYMILDRLRGDSLPARVASYAVEQQRFDRPLVDNIYHPSTVIRSNQEAP
jgi:hypothetical protein